MKNYTEMADDVLRRIGEHNTQQKNRRKVMKKVIIPICSICLVALMGLGLWQGNYFKGRATIDSKDSNTTGVQDCVELEKNNQSVDGADVIGMVKYDGANYVQCSTSTKVYTPDKYLGEAYDFEGTYKTFLRDFAGGLYMTKEDPDVLMVELKNGEYTNYVVLIKED